MLAELAAINSAMAVIKTTIAHGKDIASAGSAISKLIHNVTGTHKIDEKILNDVEIFLFIQNYNFLKL